MEGSASQVIQPRLSKRLVWALALAGLVAILLIAAGMFAFSRGSDEREHDLVGLTEADAVNRVLSESGPVRIVRGPSDQPRGTVIAQRSGNQRGTQAVIVLVVSTG